MKRQKKYKSIDPFNKNNLNGKSKADDDKFNKAPSKKDDHFAESAGFKKFQNFIEMTSPKERKDTRKPKHEEKKKKQKPDVKSKMSTIVKGHEQLPGESKVDMFRRLDNNIHVAMNEAINEEKVLRKKRKEHLKARDAKKKNKGKTPEEKAIKEFSGLKDDVKFGERVDAPPSLTSAPRNAAKSAGKPKILQLHSLLGDKETKKNNPQQQQKNNSGIKRRREMGEVEKEKFDEERQRAIDAYRLAKKRREMKSS